MKIFSYIIGNSENYTLNHRISNSILMLSGIFGIQATVGNIMLGLPNLTIYSSIIVGAILFFLYYISRFKNKREIAVIAALTISAIFYIPIMWVGNGGSYGGMVYYIFLYGAFTMSVVDGKKSFIYIFLFLSISFVLYILEYNNLIYIYNYNTNLDRLLDMLISFVFVLLGISITIYIYKNEYKKGHNLLAEKNIQLNQLIEEVISQKDEIATQRDRVSEQHYLISKQKESISDSINYAKKIQNAVLPTTETLTNILKNYFIIYKPKDIVSGDFYWVTQLNEYKIVAVADCTGHGVPGGFMSMLGISFLNEIVNKKLIVNAANILNELRNNVIYSLKQHGNIGEQSDGMDFSICVLNNKTLELDFAGANNFIYILSKNEILNKNQDKIKKHICTNEPNIKNNLYQIYPDKMPISYYVNMNNFSNIKLQLNKNDTIYMFSDGYADQFNYKTGRKLGYIKFRDYIRKCSCETMLEQYNELTYKLENWQGSSEQIDDITILGFKV